MSTTDEIDEYIQSPAGRVLRTSHAGTVQLQRIEEAERRSAALAQPDTTPPAAPMAQPVPGQLVRVLVGATYPTTWAPAAVLAAVSDGWGRYRVQVLVFTARPGREDGLQDVHARELTLYPDRAEALAHGHGKPVAALA